MGKLGIAFDSLFVITNMPIKRFQEYLRKRGEVDQYMGLLHDSFNAATLDGLMCRDTLSVGWDGKVFDCDFNQQLGLGLGVSVFDLEPGLRIPAPIVTRAHCYGCTAGQGSS